jgi:hypothetical protein
MDDSIILEGEISDAEDIDLTADGEVEKFIDSMNKHISNTKTLDKRIHEFDNEIKILRTQVFQLQRKLDNGFKYTYYLGAAFSASFAVTIICLRRLRD